MLEVTRHISTHHDGHGLNESILIGTDAPDPSGAAHFYVLTLDGELVGELRFQKGPRNVAGSQPGITEAALLAILIDRLRGFQAGPYACQENEDQLVHLDQAMRLTKARADERAARGVLGRNAK